MISKHANNILELLHDAKSSNEWGGSEDERGALMPGYVDWDKLIGSVAAELKNLEEEADNGYF